MLIAAQARLKHACAFASAGSDNFNAISAAQAVDLGHAQPFLGALHSCHRFADEALGRWTVHCSQEL
jgi:hypothetical protein